MHVLLGKGIDFVLDILLSNLPVMYCGMMFCEIISVVVFAWLPVELKLVLSLTIS